MNFFDPIIIALTLLLGGDAELYSIISLSLQVSLTATCAALIIGIPLGAVLATASFPGRSALIVLGNTMLGMPPVVIGLLVYVLISKSGPLGFLDLLYTPSAMMLAQFILVLPLSMALSRQLFDGLQAEYDLFFASVGVRSLRRIWLFIIEGKFSLVTIAMVCFGRAISEIGAVILVGGNIKHVTRVMTSAIALETSKGELAFAIALGIVLMLIALIVNLSSHLVGVHLLKEPQHAR